MGKTLDRMFREFLTTNVTLKHVFYSKGKWNKSTTYFMVMTMFEIPLPKVPITSPIWFGKNCTSFLSLNEIDSLLSHFSTLLSLLTGELIKFRLF